MDLRGITEFIKDFAVYIILFIFVFLIFIFVLSFQQIYGTSMAPNYNHGDIVVLSKIRYLVGQVKTGDVVALNNEDGVLYVKRVIAGPGDNIYAKEGVVYLNDIAQKESYLDNIETKDFTFNTICQIDGCELGVLPDKMYFVLGDNRTDSYDSRFKMFGLVKEDNIIGKVIFRIWPINKLGIVN